MDGFLYGSGLALSGAFAPAPPKGEPLADRAGSGETSKVDLIGNSWALRCEPHGRVERKSFKKTF